MDKRQLLVLADLNNATYYSSITAAIKKISSKHSIPESTLRSHVKKLRDWRLIDVHSAKPTEGGMTVLKIVGLGDDLMIL